MNQVFVSYSRKDEIFARRLAADLDRDGLDVWLDVEDIPPGANWSNAINDGLNQADLMLLILTPHSVDSKNVEDEWQYFHNHGKLIIPLWLEPSGRLHYQLARLQYIDFKEQDYETAYDAMLLEMRNKGFDVERLSETIARVEAQRTEAEVERDRLQREIEALERAAAERDRLRRELDAVQQIDAEQQRLKAQLEQLHQEEELYAQVKESEQKRQTANEENSLSTVSAMPDTDTTPLKNKKIIPPTRTEPAKVAPKKSSWIPDNIAEQPTVPAPIMAKSKSQSKSGRALEVETTRPRYPRSWLMGGLGVVVLIIVVIALAGLLSSGDDGNSANTKRSNDNSFLTELTNLEDIGDAEITSIAWSPDGDKFATSFKDGTVQVYQSDDIDSAEYFLIKELNGSDDIAYRVMWNDDSDRLAVFSESGVIDIWDSHSPNSDDWYLLLAADINASVGDCTGEHNMDWHIEENWLIVGCSHTLVLVDADGNNDLITAALDTDVVIETIAWSNTDSYLAVGESNGQVSVWDTEGFKIDHKFSLEDYGFSPPSGGVADMAWHQSESYLAIGGRSGRGSIIDIWSIEIQENLEDSAVYQDRLYEWEYELDALDWEQEGTYLVTLDYDTNTLGFWNNYANELDLTEYYYEDDGKLWALDWHPWNSDFLITAQIETDDSPSKLTVWEFSLDPHAE